MSPNKSKKGSSSVGTHEPSPDTPGPSGKRSRLSSEDEDDDYIPPKKGKTTVCCQELTAVEVAELILEEEESNNDLGSKYPLNEDDDDEDTVDRRRLAFSSIRIRSMTPVSSSKQASKAGYNGMRSPVFPSHNKPAELYRKDLISAMKLPDSEPLQAEDYLLIADPWRQEWERGVQVPVNPIDLLKPNAREAENRIHLNDFKIPRKFLHAMQDETYRQGIHELTGMQQLSEQVVRYDLDDLDICWLGRINDEREEMGQVLIHEWTMERIIEALENECHDKMTNLMRSEEVLGIEYDADVACDVCRSKEGEDENEMVFCDGCNMCVHQACYGIQVIPTGDWLCRTCALGITPQCVLCPNLGGAMKSTRSGSKWAHVSCALWIPEVSIGVPEKMEPITKISSIPPSRWSLVCCLCKNKQGACIQCSVKTCKTAFHVTCGFKNGLTFKTLLEDDTIDGVKLRAYCPKHSRRGGEEPDSPSKDPKDMTSEEKETYRKQKLEELKEAFYTMIDCTAVSKLLQLEEEVVDLIFRYWKLKRRTNFNEPLLLPKADEAEVLENRQEKTIQSRMRMFVHLRQDLERVRNLCYMVSKREKIKRQYYNAHEMVFKRINEILTDRSLNIGAREAEKMAKEYKSIVSPVVDPLEVPLKPASRGFRCGRKNRNRNNNGSNCEESGYTAGGLDGLDVASCSGGLLSQDLETQTSSHYESGEDNASPPQLSPRMDKNLDDVSSSEDDAASCPDSVVDVMEEEEEEEKEEEEKEEENPEAVSSPEASVRKPQVSGSSLRSSHTTPPQQTDSLDSQGTAAEPERPRFRRGRWRRLSFYTGKKKSEMQPKETLPTETPPVEPAGENSSASLELGTEDVSTGADLDTKDQGPGLGPDPKDQSTSSEGEPAPRNANSPRSWLGRRSRLSLNKRRPPSVRKESGVVDPGVESGGKESDSDAASGRAGRAETRRGRGSGLSKHRQQTGTDSVQAPAETPSESPQVAPDCHVDSGKPDKLESPRVPRSSKSQRHADKGSEEKAVEAEAKEIKREAEEEEGGREERAEWKTSRQNGKLPNTKEETQLRTSRLRVPSKLRERARTRGGEPKHDQHPTSRRESAESTSFPEQAENPVSMSPMDSDISQADKFRAFIGRADLRFSDEMKAKFRECFSGIKEHLRKNFNGIDPSRKPGSDFWKMDKNGRVRLDSSGKPVCDAAPTQRSSARVLNEISPDKRKKADNVFETNFSPKGSWSGYRIPKRSSASSMGSAAKGTAQTPQQEASAVQSGAGEKREWPVRGSLLHGSPETQGVKKNIFGEFEGFSPSSDTPDFRSLHRAPVEAMPTLGSYRSQSPFSDNGDEDRRDYSRESTPRRVTRSQHLDPDENSLGPSPKVSAPPPRLKESLLKSSKFS